ncbi:MAG: MAPEG family protein [Gammaproteobacteria bacterium]|nr:MAPEG family protein [Gammaproteobacteria bacterium]
MQSTLIFPMAAMVSLTVVVMIGMVRSRIRAVKHGEVKSTYYKTHQGDTEPREVAQFTRHVANLFETPVLFYVACLAAMITRQGGTLLMALAWTFVALRVVHAIVHLRSNKIPLRMNVFGTSCIVLIAMWVTLTLGVAAAQ